MDKIESMRIFMRVAELESFTRAAETMSLPKATISTSVQQLETNLGTRLLQRTTRRVQLTQDGQIFYERCKDLLSDVEEVENMFQESTARLTGRIRVDMGVSMARGWVIPKLGEFLERHPGLEVELSSTDRRVDLVREGFDCVVRVGNLNDSGLIVRPVGKLQIVNCASPSYLEKFGRPRKIEDLHKHYLVQYQQTLGTKPDGFEYFEGEKYRSIQMKSKITVNNVDAYSAACVAGLGIVQVPSVGIKDHLKNKRMEEILPKFRAEAMPVSILYPHRRNVAKRVQVFIEWLEEILQDVAD